MIARSVVSLTCALTPTFAHHAESGWSQDVVTQNVLFAKIDRMEGTRYNDQQAIQYPSLEKGHGGGA